MKNRKISLANFFKLGILFFGISLLLWNCEHDNHEGIEVIQEADTGVFLYQL